MLHPGALKLTALGHFYDCRTPPQTKLSQPDRGQQTLHCNNRVLNQLLLHCRIILWVAVVEHSYCILYPGCGGTSWAAHIMDKFCCVSLHSVRCTATLSTVAEPVSCSGAVLAQCLQHFNATLCSINASIVTVPLLRKHCSW